MKFRSPLLAACVGLASTSAVFAQHSTAEPSYLVGANSVSFTPLLTVGDHLPLTGGAPGERYFMTGIPDAMGVHQDRVTGERVLFMAHEFGGTTLSQPFSSKPADTSSLKGSYVSRFVLDEQARVLEAGLAHRAVVVNGMERSNPDGNSATNGFGRFCSGTFIGREHGLDRPIFFANEESTPCLDPAGPQSVLIADGLAYTAPALGRVGRENTVVQPRRDQNTVVISTEDAGASYLYLFVGQKKRTGTVLQRNGLDAGTVYVLATPGAAADASLQENEGTYFDPTAPALNLAWIEIPGAAGMTSTALKTAADDAGGFAFTRVEDAEFDPAAPTQRLFFTATGGSRSNRLGRVYQLAMDPRRPTGAVSLKVVINADQVVTPGGSIVGAVKGRLIGTNAADGAGYLGDYGWTAPDTEAAALARGQDYPVSVDNLALTANHIILCEDANSPADAVFAQHGRNGGVWMLDRTNNYAASLCGTFNMDYADIRDSKTLAPGDWEASGVINAEHVFGPNKFIINVQAHGAPRANVLQVNGDPMGATERSNRFREDGQVLLMTLPTL